MEKKLPTDAHVLVSFLNTKLRDEYDSLDALCDDYDVKDDELLAKNLDLNLVEFKEILKELDPDDIILLDISGVGTEKGYNKELLDKFDDLKEKLIIAGGLNKESLAELESLGIKKVLIGTSLHSGEVKILD